MSETQSLDEAQCTPCRGGEPALSAAEAERYRQHAPDWQILDESTRIERRFDFKTFAEAWRFVDAVARLAEEQGHHPDVCFGWGYARISLQTKKIKGLHQNDFIMAAQIDRRYEA